MQSNREQPPRSATRGWNKTDGGLLRERSIFSAARSGLSESDSGKLRAAELSLLQRLPDASQALRYEAVLDAFTHMGKQVKVREYYDYATAGNPVVFAAVRPLASGAMEIGVALSHTEDESLVPCLGEWVNATILAKFTLKANEPLAGKQLRFLRLASRAVAR